MSAAKKRKSEEPHTPSSKEPRTDQEKRGRRTPKGTGESAAIEWEVFYMSVAALESRRSNCTDELDKVSRT